MTVAHLGNFIKSILFTDVKISRGRWGALERTDGCVAATLHPLVESVPERVKYSALFSQRYGVEKLLGGVKDLLLPGILLGMLDHQEE